MFEGEKVYSLRIQIIQKLFISRLKIVKLVLLLKHHAMKIFFTYRFFSDTTEYSYRRRCRFCKRNSGKIYLIHVAPADIGFAIGDMGFQYFPEIEKSEISRRTHELNEIEKRIKSKGVACEHLLKQGIAAEIILDYAKRQKITIKSTSHGRSRNLRCFVGEVLPKDI